MELNMRIWAVVEVEGHLKVQVGPPVQQRVSLKAPQGSNIWAHELSCEGRARVWFILHLFCAENRSIKF